MMPIDSPRLKEKFEEIYKKVKKTRRRNIIKERIRRKKNKDGIFKFWECPPKDFEDSLATIPAARKELDQRHVAGVIPVSSTTLKQNYNTILPDVLMPLAHNYTMIEHSVYCCAMAGCDSIWLVLDSCELPVFKHILGDWVFDPVLIKTKKGKEQKSGEYKRIPIIYVPVGANHYKKRESLHFSIFLGVDAAYKEIKKSSKWFTPDVFWVNYPFGIYDPIILKNIRNMIKSKRRVCFSNEEEKTGMSGAYLPFTFFMKEWGIMKNYYDINELTKKKFKTMQEKGEESLQISTKVKKRYNIRFIPNEEVFEEIVKIRKNDIIIEPPWYYDLSTFEGYCKFLGSEEKKYIQRPDEALFPLVEKRNWKPFSVNEIKLKNAKKMIEEDEEKYYTIMKEQYNIDREEIESKLQK